MAKRKKKTRRPIEFVRPTGERETYSEFRSAGPAVKVIEPIETLHSTGKLTARQFKGLARYADVASAAQRSEIKCNIDFSIPGNGEGLPHFGVRMRSELEWLENSLGPLKAIAFAVCVDLKSVSQWAMEQTGAKQRWRGPVTWFEPRRRALNEAMEDIQSAGDRLANAIGA